MCRTGRVGTFNVYVTCIENAGRWSCAVAHWNRTAEYISADEESADKESRRIEFSSHRALERDRRANRCVLRIM